MEPHTSPLPLPLSPPSQLVQQAVMEIELQTSTSPKRNSCRQAKKVQGRVDPNKGYCMRCPHRVEVVDIEELATKKKRERGLGLALGVGDGDEQEHEGNELEDERRKQGAGYCVVEEESGVFINSMGDGGDVFATISASPASPAACADAREKTRKKKMLARMRIGTRGKISGGESKSAGEKMDGSFILVSPTLSDTILESPTLSDTTSMVFVDELGLPRRPLAEPEDECDVLFHHVREPDSGEYFSQRRGEEEEFEMLSSRSTSFDGGFATIHPTSPLMSMGYCSPVATPGSHRTSITWTSGIVSPGVSIIDSSFHSTRANSFELTPTPEYLASFAESTLEQSLAVELEQAMELEESMAEKVEPGEVELNKCQAEGCQSSHFSDDSSDDEGLCAGDGDGDGDGDERVRELVRRVSVKYVRMSSESDKLALILKEEGAVADFKVGGLMEEVLEKETKVEKVVEKAFDDAGKEITAGCSTGGDAEELNSAIRFEEIKEVAETNLKRIDKIIAETLDLPDEVIEYEASILEPDTTVLAEELQDIKINDKVNEMTEIEAAKPDDGNSTKKPPSLESIVFFENPKDAEDTKITVGIVTSRHTNTATEAPEFVSRRIISWGPVNTQRTESAVVAQDNDTDSDDDLGPLLALKPGVCMGCQIGICPASNSVRYSSGDEA